jgi:hypothetical protein
MKTALFPFVVLIHAFSMLLGMASLSFIVFTGRLSTFLVLALLSLTASRCALPGQRHESGASVRNYLKTLSRNNILRFNPNIATAYCGYLEF